ncbi:MAG TPA: hypothetical protein DCM08_09835 [Microscillaceae bacterium]|nr:hypothetical protein [Microscillaceae bacterium]
MEIGQKLEKFRTLLRMSQQQFAESVKIPQSTYSKMETGVSSKIYVSNLAKIAEKYGLSLDWLVLDKGDPPKIDIWKMDSTTKTKNLDQNGQGSVV